MVIRKHPKKASSLKVIGFYFLRRQVPDAFVLNTPSQQVLGDHWIFSNSSVIVIDGPVPSKDMQPPPPPSKVAIFT